MGAQRDFTYIQIEERLNYLMCTEEIRRLRFRAVNWVLDRLRLRVEARLSEAGLTPAVLERYAAEQEPGGAVERLVLEKLDLSRERKREFRLLSAGNRAAAAEWIREQLLAREQILFRTKAGIPAATWQRFLQCASYTGDKTAGRISAGLGLDEEEDARFRGLLIRERFGGLKPARDSLMERLRERNLTITEFLIHAMISQRAWESFRAGDGVTSQGTLLKMVVGLSMTPEEGKAFLNLVGSAFVMRRDLVVLACLWEGIYDTDRLYEILEVFAAGYGGERLYQNLY